MPPSRQAHQGGLDPPEEGRDEDEAEGRAVAPALGFVVHGHSLGSRGHGDRALGLLGLVRHEDREPARAEQHARGGDGAAAGAGTKLIFGEQDWSAWEWSAREYGTREPRVISLFWHDGAWIRPAP